MQKLDHVNSFVGNYIAILIYLSYLIIYINQINLKRFINWLKHLE